MDVLVAFLVFCQALGAFIGAFVSVWSEIVYVRAMRDGHVDAAERMHLSMLARGLRFGMLLLLLASFGLIIVDYQLRLAFQPALSSSYWISVMLALLIIGSSWALSRRRISFAFGSAAAFAAWWLLVYLTFGFLPLSFGAAAALYLVLAAILYGVLILVRSVALRKK